MWRLLTSLGAVASIRHLYTCSDFTTTQVNLNTPTIPIWTAQPIPSSCKFRVTRRVLVDAKISLSRTDKLVDSLFEPLSNGTVTDFPSCADLEKNVSPPLLATKVPPDYPQNARQSHHEGTVWLYFSVGKSGAVEQLRVVGHTWPELDDSAAGAVRQWKYTPYMRCGEAVPFETLVNRHYSLSP